MAALKFRTPIDPMRPEADTTPPPPNGDAYSAQTREIHLTENLVARLMEAQERAERKAEERDARDPRVSAVVKSESVERTVRRRKRMDAETLDRDNPFLDPTPMAPWESMPIPTPVRMEVPGQLLQERRDAAPAAPMRRRGEGVVLELVVLVWTLLIAIVAVAHHYVR